MRTAISIIGLVLAAGLAPTAVRAEVFRQAPTSAGAHGAHGADESAKPPKKKLVCRRDQASETRLRSVRVCLTAEEWKAKDRRSS